VFTSESSSVEGDGSPEKEIKEKQEENVFRVNPARFSIQIEKSDTYLDKQKKEPQIANSQ